MASIYYRGTNRDKATNEQIFTLCELLWADENLHPAFNRVGEDGYFDMDEYIQIHNMVTGILAGAWRGCVLR